MAYINGKKIFSVIKTEYVEVHPAGTDTEANILAFDEDKGIWIGTDTGYWYYWNGTQYVSGGAYMSAFPDDEMSDSSTNAVENKVIKEYVDNAINDLENGALVVAKSLVAKQLENVSEESGATQENPFIFQGTGTENNTSETPTSPIAKQLEKQGNSVVVNQILNNTKATFTENGMTFTNNNDGTITINGIATATTLELNITTSVSFKKDHKYLIGGLKVISGIKYGVRGFALNHNSDYIFTYNNDWIGAIAIELTNGATANNVVIKPIVIDLTQWFGSNDLIPQDLLDNPSHFSWYYQGPLAYNTGELQNSNGRYLVNTHRQQWDEEWEVGGISADNGANIIELRIRSKNYIRVIPNRKYYFYMGATANGRVFFYDKDKNFIAPGSWGVKTTFTTPSNCCFMRFTGNDTYGTTYKNDITISLYYETGDGYDEYYPYQEPKVYDTGSEVLRSAGSVCDKKLPSGEIIRNIKNDALSGGWVYNSNNNYFYKLVTDILPTALPNDLSCDKYSVTNKSLGDMVSGEIKKGTNENILYLKDTSLNGDTSLISGNINYPLATPTTEQGTPFDEVIEVDDYGTMAWKDSNDEFVEIPQGCKIFYPADYSLLIDDLGNYTEYDVTKLALKEELNNKFETYMKSLSGYDSTKTQVLKNVEGTLTWVDEE